MASQPAQSGRGAGADSSATGIADPGTILGADAHADQIAVESTGGPPVAGVGPYRLAARRLRRNKVALASGALFLVLVAMCLLAPVYAHRIAHIGPTDNNVSGSVVINGKKTDVVNSTGLPIGPTWRGQYFFGADTNGRDVAVRLLYGGRNSLVVGAIATLITVTLATLLALLAGYLRGGVDAVLSRVFDIIWSFPVVLLG